MTLLIIRKVDKLIEEILPHLGEVTIVMTGEGCYSKPLNEKTLYLMEHCESLGIEREKVINYRELIKLIVESRKVVVW